MQWQIETRKRFHENVPAILPTHADNKLLQSPLKEETRTIFLDFLINKLHVRRRTGCLSTWGQDIGTVDVQIFRSCVKRSKGGRLV